MSHVLVRRVSLPVLGIASACAVLVPNAMADRPAADPAAGRAAYERYCARCHGLEGKGDGRDSKRHFPRPRDFTSGTYKFRSTATGTSPTDDDLFQTITNGLPGSGMPDWRHLDEATRWQLVDYLKTLSNTFKENPPQPVSTGQDPGPKHADLAKGRQVFEKLGCAACHGARGRANGTSAATLTDTWNRSVRPADLTTGWAYRGGSEPNAILLRMLAGIDGTPMPSYAEAVSTDDAWQLAYYVRSLQEEPHWAAIVRASYLDRALPDSPTDPLWNSTDRADVLLRPAVNASGEIAAPQTVPTVSVRTLYNDQAVSFRISWRDPSESRDESPDALALALRPGGVSGDIVTLQAWPLAHTPALDLCVWTANALKSREAVAKRYEPVVDAKAAVVPLAGDATYQDGEWTLVLSRPLVQTALPDSAQITPGEFLPVAFAVWDGGNPQQRAVSMWIEVRLETPAQPRQADRSVYVVGAAAAVVIVIGLGFVLRKA